MTLIAIRETTARREKHRTNVARRANRDNPAFSLACLLLAVVMACIAAPKSAAAQDETVEISGDLRQWHRVTLSFNGPETSETADNNPFLNYRLETTFTGPSGQEYVIPGFFAADGEAGRSGAEGGKKWQVRFAPDESGQWRYRVAFEQGQDVSVADEFGTGETVALHGTAGQFNIDKSDKRGDDFRASGKGLIRNRGHHYLTYADGGIFIKGGPDIPENLLGYSGFDNTPNFKHEYAPHREHWRDGDPNWERHGEGEGVSDGKNLVGAINYVAEHGGNCIYFLPMNIGGDGQDTFPTIAPQEKTRYDVSKLEQWEILFTHAQSLGVFLHFQLAETEDANENYHDDGELGPQRKLYYRELIARFGHHPGLQWNLGEENDYGPEKRKRFAAFIKSIDPYDHPLTTHTHTNQEQQFYGPLLGNDDFDLAGFQTSRSGADLSDEIEKWRRRSAEAGVPWVISIDEPQVIHNDLSDQQQGYPAARRKFLWPVYLSGAGGFEWYVQSDGGGHDLDQRIEDFGQMREALEWTRHARRFLLELPLMEMQPDDDLVRGESDTFGGAQVLAKPGAVYAIYLPDAADGEPQLDLSDQDGAFELRWYDPRRGKWHEETTSLNGGGWVTLRDVPDSDGEARDWAAVVRKR